MQIYAINFLLYLPWFTSNVSESEENLIINYISFGSMFTPLIHGTPHVLLADMKLMERNIY